jgi:hypothetical protein
MPESVTVSPAVRKRGIATRMMTSLRSTTFETARPTFRSVVTARAVARHVVRLSGRSNLTCALPSAPVTSAGCQKAVSLKIFRTSGFADSSLKSASWRGFFLPCARLIVFWPA